MDRAGLTYPSGIVPSAKWNYDDSTKIKQYLDCPRKYFFRFVLGWVQDYPNIHLDFGTAIHAALEHILIKGSSPKDLSDAYDKFLSIYRESFPPETDDAHAPKNPENAFSALCSYSQLYTEEDKLLFTEVAGVVPVDEERSLSFKIDAVMEGEKGVYALEHKTTGRDSRDWRDQWLLNIQPHTYIHALCCAFPRERVYGTVINGLILRKKGNDFVRIPVIRTDKGMAAWHFDVLYTLDRIDYDFHSLTKCNQSDHVLAAFCRNTESCTKYGVCPYHAYCQAWSNPLAELQRYAESGAPPGMRVDHWDPTEVMRDAKYTIEGDHIKPCETPPCSDGQPTDSATPQPEENTQSK